MLKVLEKDSAEFTLESRCKDFDGDFSKVPCFTACWLYDPEQGWCPFLVKPEGKLYEEKLD